MKTLNTRIGMLRDLIDAADEIEKNFKTARMERGNDIVLCWPGTPLGVLSDGNGGYAITSIDKATHIEHDGELDFGFPIVQNGLGEVARPRRRRETIESYLPVVRDTIVNLCNALEKLEQEAIDAERKAKGYDKTVKAGVADRPKDHDAPDKAEPNSTKTNQAPEVKATTEYNPTTQHPGTIGDN